MIEQEEYNRRYYVTEGVLDKANDYKNIMILENVPRGIVIPSERVIDSKHLLFYDISERESLLHALTTHTLRRDFYTKLFESLANVSIRLKSLLMEESDVYLTPERIFRSIRGGDFYFLYCPGRDKEEAGINELFETLITAVDASDQTLYETIFTIYNRLEEGYISFESIYEMYMQGLGESEVVEMETKHEPEIVEEIEQIPERTEKSYFVPSFREVAAVLCMATGLFIIGYNTYLSLI